MTWLKGQDCKDDEGHDDGPRRRYEGRVAKKGDQDACGGRVGVDASVVPMLVSQQTLLTHVS